MTDEYLFANPEDESEIKAQEEFNELVYITWSTPHGKELMGKLEDMLKQQRWYPNDDPAMGYFREGGNAMLRYLLECYTNGENK